MFGLAKPWTHSVQTVHFVARTEYWSWS